MFVLHIRCHCFSCITYFSKKYYQHHLVLTLFRSIIINTYKVLKKDINFTYQYIKHYIQDEILYLFLSRPNNVV